MITKFQSLMLIRRRKKNIQQPAMILKTLLSFSRTEVLSREEQINTFGKGYSFTAITCSVYDPTCENFVRIS